MIIRIVKMKFQTDKTGTFLSLFKQIRKEIESFEGCRKVRLMQDRKDPAVFFTYSEWDSEDHLNKYRHSAFFGNTWKKTKALFDKPPEAWSLENRDVGRRT